MKTEVSNSKTKARKGRAVTVVEYLLYRCLFLVFSSLPLTVSYRLAEGLVALLYGAVPRLGRRAKEHIELCFGKDFTEQEKRDLYHRFLQYHSWFWVDMLLGPHLLQKRKKGVGIEMTDALAALGDASEKGQRGVLLVSSHQGTPDLITLSLGMIDRPVAAIARRLDNPLIHNKLIEDRKPFPRIELSKEGGLRPAFRHLRQKGIVGLQIDQDAGPKGLFVPYFGRLASTHSSAGMLASLAHCPVLMVFAIRTEPRRFRYKLVAERIEAPSDRGDTDANVLEWTRIMTQSIERMARRYPEQVLWTHRRWKTRPPPEANGSTRFASRSGPSSNKLANRPYSLDRRGAK